MSTTEIITQKELMKDVSPSEQSAKQLVILSASDMEFARDLVRDFKEAGKAVVARTLDLVTATNKAHKEAVKLRDDALNLLVNAEKIVKGKMSSYQLECERLARIEREKAEKEAKEKQEKAIEAARKKIQAAMDKAGTVQEKIDALEASLANDGLDETAKVMTERQIETLRLQLQKFEDKAQDLQNVAEEIAETPAYIPPAAVLEKTSGVSTKKAYTITSIDSAGLIAEIAAGKGSANLVKAWDETTIKKLALMGVFYKSVSYAEERSVSVR